MAGHGLYDNSPKMKRDEHGKMGVKKDEKKTEEHKEGKEKNEPASSGLPTHVMHAQERMDMHRRHEMEHAVHDNGKGGEKKDMHARHMKEKKDMFTRHEKEPGATAGSADVGESIAKIEKGAKA